MSGAFDPTTFVDDDWLIVRAWNMMNGEVNWAALPVVMAMFGVTDPEPFIVKVLALRDFKQREERAR